MVNVDALKGAIRSAGLTQKSVYEKMGLSRRQWQFRMDQKKLDSDEIYSLMDIVPMTDPMPIFFAPKNTSDA